MGQPRRWLGSWRLAKTGGGVKLAARGRAPLFGQRREEEESRVVLEIYKSLGG